MSRLDVVAGGLLWRDYAWVWIFFSGKEGTKNVEMCEAVSKSQVGMWFRGIDHIAIHMTTICVVCISRASGESPKLGEDP